MTNRDRLIKELKAIGNSADLDNLREYERVAIDAYQYIMELEKRLEESKKRTSDLGWQLEYNRLMGFGR